MGTTAEQCQCRTKLELGTYADRYQEKKPVITPLYMSIRQSRNKYVRFNQHPTVYRTWNTQPICLGQIKPKSRSCRLGESQRRYLHQYSLGPYLQVLFNEELHRVSLGQVELSKEQCNRIERLAEVGKASPAEVAEAKARVAQDEMNAVQTGNNYQLAFARPQPAYRTGNTGRFPLGKSNPPTIELIPLASPDEIYPTALGCKASCHKRHSIVWKEVNTVSESPKALIIRNWLQRESRNELLFDNQSHFQPANEW